jgi:choline dehydrogenase-like flavoprotein
MNESDYIVAGGGTAGCVVAARLVGRGCSVTLLEAGGPYSRVLDIPVVGLWAIWLSHLLGITVPGIRAGLTRIPWAGA